MILHILIIGPAIFTIMILDSVLCIAKGHNENEEIQQIMSKKKTRTLLCIILISLLSIFHNFIINLLSSRIESITDVPSETINSIPVMFNYIFIIVICMMLFDTLLTSIRIRIQIKKK